MQLVALVIILSLLLTWWVDLGRPGNASKPGGQLDRGHATGHSLVFIGALWFFGTFVDPGWGAGLGLLHIALRLPFAIRRRQAGVTTARLLALIELALLIGALVGLARHWSLLS